MAESIQNGSGKKQDAIEPNAAEAAGTEAGAGTAAGTGTETGVNPLAGTEDDILKTFLNQSQSFLQKII